jgi:hypothetical protein
MKKPVLAVAFAFLFALPLLAANKNTTLDLDGTPDLIVADTLGSQWVVREENLAANFCSVIEGGVTPGLRKLVRFTVTTPNVGDADLFVGDPNDPANVDLFEFAECHAHHHFKEYAKYELIDPRTGFVWRAAKRGFCMLDTDPVPTSSGNEQPRAAQFRSCGAIGIAGHQGVSHGWADTYRFFLGGQYFVLDGGDGQAPVPAGDYILRITVNPAFAPDRRGRCLRAKNPATGLCHQFVESNYANNVRETILSIPNHPGREGVGPLKNEQALGFEPAEHE